jgi:hypothetical protein
MHYQAMPRTPAPEYETVPPEPAALVESLRAFGYELSTALADLADNSVFHHSRHIAVHFHWAGENSAIGLADDGDGMDERTLVNAMRLGSCNPREPREPGDLGRFGLGLKTASFSQCRRVSVFTKARRKEPLIRCWDLDHIAETGEWQLLRTPSPLAARLAEKVAAPKQGTVVIWEKLDRLAERNSFLLRDKNACSFGSRLRSTTKCPIAQGSVVAPCTLRALSPLSRIAPNNPGGRQIMSDAFSKARAIAVTLLNTDHDVTAASRPVKAFVPVRIRLVTPISMGRR